MKAYSIKPETSLSNSKGNNKIAKIPCKIKKLSLEDNNELKIKVDKFQEKLEYFV